VAGRPGDLGHFPASSTEGHAERSRSLSAAGAAARRHAVTDQGCPSGPGQALPPRCSRGRSGPVPGRPGGLPGPLRSPSTAPMGQSTCTRPGPSGRPRREGAGARWRDTTGCDGWAALACRAGWRRWPFGSPAGGPGAGPLRRGWRLYLVGAQRSLVGVGGPHRRSTATRATTGGGRAGSWARRSSLFRWSLFRCRRSPRGRRRHGTVQGPGRSTWPLTG
jgi:hypothetical protein